jgi:hypothetical protein
MRGLHPKSPKTAPTFSTHTSVAVEKLAFQKAAKIRSRQMPYKQFVGAT